MSKKEFVKGSESSPLPFTDKERALGVTKGFFTNEASQLFKIYDKEKEVFALENETLDEFIQRGLKRAIDMQKEPYFIELEINQIDEHFGGGKQYMKFHTNNPTNPKRSKTGFGRRISLAQMKADIFLYLKEIEPQPFLFFVTFTIQTHKKRVEYSLDRRQVNPENVFKRKDSKKDPLYHFEDIHGNRGYLGSPKEK